jgi:putative peptide zinc metalloprotease protein
MVKNIAQRGRLPDMKKSRVRMTMVLVAALLSAFFFLPLPISRVRETGLLQIHDTSVYQVTVRDPGGTLWEQFVHDGDIVVKDQKLAAFRNSRLSEDIERLEEMVKTLNQQWLVHQAQLQNAGNDPMKKAAVKQEMAKVDGDRKSAETGLATAKRIFNELSVLKADRGGVVMGAPHQSDMGKFWDKAESGPFCQIGDRSKLCVLVPVSPSEYQEIKDNLIRVRGSKPAQDAFLEATILLPNRSDHLYSGKVISMPDRHEENVPVALTSRGGGPIATKPSQNPNASEPVAQTYLITVEINEPDGTMIPGVQAKVKIHLRWRSAAWWCGQKIASALEIGLW